MQGNFVLGLLVGIAVTDILWYITIKYVDRKRR